MAPRGRGGKFSKPTRGGGKKFSRDLQPLDKDGNPVNMWGDRRDVPSEEEEEEDEEEEEEEEESEQESDEEGEASSAAQPAGREERRQAAKARKEAAKAKKGQAAAAPGDLPPVSDGEDEDGEQPTNTNHTAAARSQVSKDSTLGQGGAQLTRREREALQAQQDRERYMKLHAEGKTDEARADLARLALVRERREAEKARKEAEKEEREERERQKVEARELEAKKRAEALGPAAKTKKGAKKK